MCKVQWAKRFLFVQIAIALCLSSFYTQEARGEGAVYVIGSSQIRGEDMSAGREEAINNGLIIAVSNTLTQLLPPETLTGSFQVLNESVLNKTDRFIQDYKVLSESTVGNTYRLMIQATVSEKRLKTALKKVGIRLEKIPYPRTLFCVAEQRGENMVTQYWWSSQTTPSETVSMGALTQAFSAVGFSIVPPRSNISGVDLTPELTAAQAIAIGKKLRAEVVVVGFASAQATANTMGGTVSSYRGSLTARALRVSDGTQIAQVQQASLTAGDDAYAGSREALHKAALLASKPLIAQIGDAWFQAKSGKAQVEITVQGIGGNIANFVKFRGALGTTSGVDGLQLKEMMPGQAILLVDYQGRARALADALMLLNFDTFGINIESVQGKTIQMQLVPQ